MVEYRKSGLSLNHVQGCALDCAYCIRHTYGLWDQRQPLALMSDDEAVEQLVGHRYFTPHVTPLQLFNRATDPFLPAVREHTFAVLENLDRRGLRNHVLVITRYRVRDEDCERLAGIGNLKLTLLFTYSGIDDRRIEPYPSRVAAESLATASRHRPRRYRTVLYWRPLVPGLNDSAQHFAQAADLSRIGDATVFTGLFFRDEIAAYYRASGLPMPYGQTARRKVMPETLEQRVLEAFHRLGGGPLFRKTSCAVSYAMACRTTTGMSVSGRCATSARPRSSGCAGRRTGCRRRPDPGGRGRAARGARVADRGHYAAGGRDQRPAKRTAALFPAARPGIPGSRREPPAPAAPSRPRRHRVGAIMTPGPNPGTR